MKKRHILTFGILAFVFLPLMANAEESASYTIQDAGIDWFITNAASPSYQVDTEPDNTEDVVVPTPAKASSSSAAAIQKPSTGSKNGKSPGAAKPAATVKKQVPKAVPKPAAPAKPPALKNPKVPSSNPQPTTVVPSAKKTVPAMKPTRSMSLDAVKPSQRWNSLKQSNLQEARDTTLEQWAFELSRPSSSEEAALLSSLLTQSQSMYRNMAVLFAMQVLLVLTMGILLVSLRRAHAAPVDHRLSGKRGFIVRRVNASAAGARPRLSRTQS